MSKIAKFKINIIEYYENLKNKIDIKTQTQLVNESLLDKEREELLRISNSFIEKCEETLKKTMNEIDEVAEESDPLIDQFTDKHIPNLFSSHCMLIENSILPLKNSIGLLVVSDWSMNTNEIQFTNKLFSMGDNSILEVIDERDLIQPLDNKQSMESFILTGNLFLIKYAYDCSRINKRYRNQNIFLNKHLADTIELFRQKLIADLGKTRKFHLSGFKFSLVEKDAFHFLVNLSELSLWGNQISVLTSNLFNNNLCNLIKLELFSCGIKKIESDAFAGLVHLEHLNLGHNPQIDLHCCSQFNGLKNLRYLNLSDSDFKLDINDLAIFKNFTKLVHLDIALSSLRKHIKKYLFTGLDQLEKLDLSHCMITSIESESFKCVTNLKELDLKFNYIMEIDSTTFKCLVNLDINSNGNYLYIQNSLKFYHFKILTLVNFYFY